MNNATNTPNGYNPYAAPESNLVENHKTTAGTIKYDGKHVIVKNKADFPDVCVKCGKKGHKQSKKTLGWMNPWWYLTVFINFFVLLIVSLIVRKKLKTTYFLCEEHQKKRTKKRVLLTTSFVSIVLLGFAYLPIQNSFGEDVAFIALMSSFALMMVWLITMLIVQGDFNIAKAEKQVPIYGKTYYLFHLKGISDDFLKAVNIL